MTVELPIPALINTFFISLEGACLYRQMIHARAAPLEAERFDPAGLEAGSLSSFAFPTVLSALTPRYSG